jgi:type II secretion system protein I
MSYRKLRRHASMPPDSGGFTLLEILVATAILGTSIATLFGLLSGSLNSMQRLRGPSEALMLAESQMNELLTTGIDSGNDGLDLIRLDEKREGRWNDQYRWEAMATRFHPPEQIAPGQTIMVRFVVDVFWKSGPDRPEKKLSLETYELQREPYRQEQ